MELLFLGTSSGVPTKQRSVTALALLAGNARDWYLIDCGEGTQHQILHTPLSLRNLRAICITHVHGDHCYGLPGLLASAAMSGRIEPLTLIGPQALLDWLAATQVLTTLFLPFEIKVMAVEAFAGWDDHSLHISATALSHRVPSYAYSFAETARITSLNSNKLRQENIPAGEIWGKLQRGQDVQFEGRVLLSSDYLSAPYPLKKIVIGGDNDQPELLRETCIGAQVLVHEATYTQEIAKKVGPQVQHSSAAQVAEFAQAIGLPHLILTHFSPRYQSDVTSSPSIAEIEQEAKAHYQGQLFLAADFARYKLDKEGVLALLAAPA